MGGSDPKPGWRLGAKAAEAKAQPPTEGREQAHERHPCFSVRLEYQNGNSLSVMYGTLVGAPCFNPSTGIAFVFEALHPTREGWKEGRWLVSLTGSNLRSVYEHLCLSKQQFIRVGENDYEPGEGDVPLPAGDSPHVTGISVTELKEAAKPAKNAKPAGEGPSIRARGREEATPGH